MPKVQLELSRSISKIHFSFDGWSVKGGKRAFLGIVGHCVNARGKVCDLPLALPQLAGAHTGERMADVINKTLQRFGMDPSSVGYFVLDNATNNNTAVNALASKYNFSSSDRRLRCSPHSLNLVGQTVIYGVDKDAFDNKVSQAKTEEQLLREWRRQGPLGLLVDVLHSIRTPQQYNIFNALQKDILESDSSKGVRKSVKLLEPVKPVVTRWNSYCDTFTRALTQYLTINAYIEYHIEKTRKEGASRRARQSRTAEGDEPE